MTILRNADKDEVYRSRLEALVRIAGRQSALLRRIDSNFDRRYHIRQVSSLATDAHKEREKIGNLEKYYNELNERIESILAKSPELLNAKSIYRSYQGVKNAELLYKEFKL